MKLLLCFLLTLLPLIAQQVPDPISLEDQNRILKVEKAMANYDRDFSQAQAKLVGCSVENLQSWQKQMQEARASYINAQKDLTTIKEEIQERYKAAGFRLTDQLAWEKDPGG